MNSTILSKGDGVPYQASQVFTPTSPARLNFVERKEVNDRLVNALITPGKQIIVYGHSGSGKTTLIQNKLAQTYETDVITRCTGELTFEQLILDAFDRVGPYFVSGDKKASKTTTKSSISLDYIGLKTQLGSESEALHELTRSRVLPPQLTPATLV
jgi:excinuclease UvrABC ATPase subunit